MPIDIPLAIHTSRLFMRPWSPADAGALAPILQADVARLSPWLPPRVATPAPVEALAERLAGFAADFADGRAFRYALFGAAGGSDAGALLGGADLHPRDATRRVPLDAADRVELGYWLTARAEGRGIALEATRALLEVAAALPGMSHVEARVNPHNARSAAVAQRLGFRLATHGSDADVWSLALGDR